jgi:uncharacterized protein involved in type VI secretion and phage assembly
MPICGKFRGTVVNNVDPQGLGRVEVSVPDVQGGITAFAMPCLPFAGNNVGFYACPQVGANVWVEFEGGDVNFPIWTGCFWGAGEAPAAAATPEQKIFLMNGVSLTMDDTPGSGGIKLEVNPPVSATGIQIRMDQNGVLLQHQGAKIRIGVANVSINDGALEVTV